jgi:hypothetical protein
MPELFRRRGSPKWQAELYYLDEAGERKRKLKSTGIVDDGTAASRHTAEEVARGLERGLAVPGGNRKASKTLKQAIAALLTRQELGERSADTIKITIERGKALVRGLGENTRLDQISDDRLVEYCAKQRESNCAVTVGMDMRVLNLACSAVGEPRKRLPDLGRDAKRSKPQRPLSVQEARRLLMAMTPRLRLTLLAYLQLGVRYSELRKIVAIDWDLRLLHIQATKRRIDRDGPRIVPIPPELYAEMAPLRETWAGFYVPTNRGMNKAIKRAAERAKLPNPDDYHCNDLRGTYATQMAVAGVDALTLSKIMGNSPKQLEATYAQVQKDLDHIAAQGQRLPRLRGGGPDCDNSASNADASAADTANAALASTSK